MQICPALEISRAVCPGLGVMAGLGAEAEREGVGAGLEWGGRHREQEGLRQLQRSPQREQAL